MLSEKIKEKVTKIKLGTPLINLRDRHVFVTNLLIVLGVIKESEKLLEEAIKNSQGPLKEYFTKHLSEEKNHYEWLKEDILTALNGLPETYSVSKKITDRQYKEISKNPSSFLGYMAVLEGFSMPVEYVKILEECHGAKLIRTLRLHSEDDPKHAEELWKVIDKNSNKSILKNAIATAIELKEVFRYLSKGLNYVPTNI